MPAGEGPLLARQGVPRPHRLPRRRTPLAAPRRTRARTQHQEVLDACNEAVRREPGLHEALYFKGHALAELQGRCYKGGALRRLRREGAARAAFEAVLGLAPGDAVMCPWEAAWTLEFAQEIARDALEFA